MTDDVLSSLRLLAQADLHGTQYFELLPGRYTGRCWAEDSVYLTEEAMGLLEPTVARHVPNYDHYAFCEVSRDTWSLIVADWRTLRTRVLAARALSELGDEVGFLFADTRGRLGEHFVEFRTPFATLLETLAQWIEATLARHERIAILGL